MSGNAMQAELSPSWKTEINKRVAEHKSRKGSAAETVQAPQAAALSGNRRAAEAAARVAARYAKAPSYSEVLANEARAAVRAAEAATRAAQQAQMAAESVLAGIEAISEAEAASQPVLLPSADRLDSGRLDADQRDGMRIEPLDDFFTPAPAVSTVAKPAHESSFTRGQAFEIRWEPDMPTLPSNPPVGHAARGKDRLGLRIEESQVASSPYERGEEVEVVEPAQPIHANLIEFPRELVAARKARPRLADGPYGANQSGTQLSIFEVEPSSISTLPEIGEAVEQATPWIEQRWPAIELESRTAAYDLEDVLAPPEPEPAAAHTIELAPMHRRLLAGLVDGALIAGSVLSVAALALSHATELPGVRVVEVGAVLGFMLAAILYQALFLVLAKSTPGMMYAHLQLTTFDGQIPTHAQRIRRIGALLVSVLPAGLGMAWSIFDEDRMSWHDRHSGTYPMKKPV